MKKLSPMMKQYMDTKKEYSDCVIFYRLGDFYEMFFEDAVEISKELELTLTARDCGLEEKAPMCGVPHHSAETYINRLVEKGYKVAIAEQVEDPKEAKGIVKREVIKVVTPGTIVNTMALKEDRNNYLLSIYYEKNHYGISAVDISTGDFYISELNDIKDVKDELGKYQASELICNKELFENHLDKKELEDKYNINISVLEDRFFTKNNCENIIKEHFNVSNLSGLGIVDMFYGVLASGSILLYLYETQKSNCSQITSIITYIPGEYMLIDSSTRRNLELVETMREKKKSGSLLGVLDKTKTAMGARLLRTYITQPLIDINAIKKRQDAIKELLGDYIKRQEIRDILAKVYDLERLIGRINIGVATSRDLLSFKTSIKLLPYLKNILKDYECEFLSSIYSNIDDLQNIYELIEKSINDEPPLSLKDGDIIKTGFDNNIDNYRLAKTEGKTWLSELEEKERNATGIKSLKIKFNKVFGYCFEVTNMYKNKVPEHFIRKQTLTNAERYTSDDLKKIEDVVLGAQEKLNKLEYEVFVNIRTTIASDVKKIKETAKAIANLDAILSLAYVADKNAYIKPDINTDGIVDIKDGRHPVVEQMIGAEKFIKNDTYLDKCESRVSIITGPNMAGKSTYMRQTALIALMAQIGSYVPASYANISICDRIFTRVGASDDLASGQSTFMVEMTEVSNIIRNATGNSLIILDEIGRGTSTFDGLSIAWAVVEHIADKENIGAKTLFATHYHELTELEGSIDGIKNYCISVKENGDDIILLRKIVRGGADKSYGIEVAKLAGVPKCVLDRARQLVNELISADIANKARDLINNDTNVTLIDYENKYEKELKIIEKLRQVDIDDISRKEAFDILDTLQKML